jgi:hypothetical protein
MRRKAIAIALGAALISTIGLAAPANAIELERQGNCSMGSIWTADIELERGYWDLDFEVDSRADQGTWRLLVKQNGKQVYKNRAQAIQEWDENYSEVDWSLLRKDTAGNDRFFFGAKNLATG